MRKQEFLTKEEEALVRKQLRTGNAAAREAAKKRGYKIHPKIAAKRAREEKR